MPNNAITCKNPQCQPLAAGIINDILDFSKIKAGKLALERIGFTLDEVLGAVSTMVAPRPRQGGGVAVPCAWQSRSA